MKKDHQTLYEFCNSCWKMAKNAPFHIKSPVKTVYGWAKGGDHTVPPLKYATDGSQSVLFPIVDVLIRSGDMRDQTLKLFKIARTANFR